MNKILKFAPHLVPLILSGKKTATWRLFDDKDLSEGDSVDFLEHGTHRHFATVLCTRVVEKPLNKLSVEDKRGHETYETDEEMYQMFSKYYDRPIGPDSIVKIIWYVITDIKS